MHMFSLNSHEVEFLIQTWQNINYVIDILASQMINLEHKQVTPDTTLLMDTFTSVTQTILQSTLTKQHWLHLD